MDERSRRGSLPNLPNYVWGKTLGLGAFGKVIGAQHILTGIKVAVKILGRQSIEDSAMDKVRREINIMRLLSHPHIVRLYEVIETRSAIYLIMEHMECGELYYYITENGRLEEDEARHFFQQIISGIESCHLHMVVHRDLKAENLLLDSRGNVKLADFGFSNVMRDGHLLKTSCGSPEYAAPEVLSRRLYAGPEVDVWSCGVILYSLLSGGLPFVDENLSILVAKIKSGRFACPNYLSTGARDLILRMLTVDPVNRISIPEIYKHPWFQMHLPRYIADPSINTSWSERKVDDGVLEEMAILGFNVEEVIASLSNSLQNQATVSYSMLLHRRLNNHSYQTENLLGSSSLECTARREIYIRPIAPVQGKWVLGFKSFASPHKTLRGVLNILNTLNVRWKKIGPFNIKCLWIPAVHSYSVIMGIQRIALREDTNSLNMLIKNSNTEKLSMTDAVKFEIQLYRASLESYLLDWQRIHGPPFLFMELCAGFHACVIA